MACKDSMLLIIRNPLRFSMMEGLGTLFIIIGTMFITIGNSTLFYYNFIKTKYLVDTEIS